MIVTTKSALAHESGHGVIAHLLGLSVEEVSVIREGASHGHMSGLPIESRYVARAAVYGGNSEVVHRELLVLAAGPVSEFIESGATILPKPFNWPRYGGGNDEAVAERLIGAGDGLITTDLHDIVSEVWDLLRDERIWQCVERVVRELKHLGDLDHATFIGAVEGDYDFERR
jgi:hypothetical protein